MSVSRVLFIGGLGRSGSTLAGRLLGQLPGAVLTGELSQMWRRGIVLAERCGCGEPFPACPFWRKVGETGFGGWDNVDAEHFEQLRLALGRSRFIPRLAAPPLMGSAFKRALSEFVSYYERAYAAVLEVSGGEVVIDSSKNAALAFCLHRSPNIDLRVVHVVRDSRAVAYSWTKRVSRPEAPPGSYMMRYSPATSAILWNTQNASLHLLRRVGVPVLRIRYEDLAAAPVEKLREIASFAGLPAGDSDISFLGSDGAERWADLELAHTASGNPMRFNSGRTEIRLDDSWRAAFPRPGRTIVSLLTMPGLVRYRYL